MKKPKIAISLDLPLLESIDKTVDGLTIRSRSQAIELLLNRALGKDVIKTAVILLKGSQQSKVQTHLNNQINYLKKHGINHIIYLTQTTPTLSNLSSTLSKSGIKHEIITKNLKGNAEMLQSIKEKLPGDFVVYSGDIVTDFNISQMMERHKKSQKLATMALMSKEKPEKYGIAIVEGDQIIEFQEKPKTSSTTIVSGGVYIFKKEILELFDDKTTSLEKDLFPKLAKMKQLVSFFIYGHYQHIN